jgi:methanol metabolism-related c-type cytochrome
MRSSLAGALALGVMMFVGTSAMAEAPGDPKAVKSEGGKYVDAKGDPTYNIGADGAVDYYTYNGWKRYHADCHQCHGPNAGGSTMAPALKESLQRLNYAEFAGIVIGGRQNGNSVMPAWGDNKNVACNIDDLYVYIRAMSTSAIQPGRPEKHEPKSEARAKAENECMNAK